LKDFHRRFGAAATAAIRVQLNKAYKAA